MSVTANPRVAPVNVWSGVVPFYFGQSPVYERLLDATPSNRRREWTVSIRTHVASAAALMSLDCYATSGSSWGRSNVALATTGPLGANGNNAGLASPGGYVGSNTSRRDGLGGGWPLTARDIWVFTGSGAEFLTYTMNLGPSGPSDVSPNGRWIVGAAGANTLRSYPIMPYVSTSAGSSILSARVGTNYTSPGVAPTVGTITSVKFNAAGTYVALAGGTTPYVEVYAFDQSTGTIGSKVSAPAAPPAGAAKTVRWSPDGTYLAVGHATSPFVSLWAWTGSAFGTKAANPGTLPNTTVNTMAWHPASTYLFCGVAAASTTLNNNTYPISGGASPAFGTSVGFTGPLATAIYNCAWAPDGLSLFFGMGTTSAAAVTWGGSSWGTPVSTLASWTGTSTDESGVLACFDGVTFWLGEAASGTIRETKWAPSTNTSSWPHNAVPPLATRWLGRVNSIPVVNGANNYHNWPAPLRFSTGPGDEVVVLPEIAGSSDWYAVQVLIEEYDL